jgi:hypothetical protein
VKTLFDPEAASGFKARMQQLTPDRKPLWGRMNVAQAVAHCAAAFEVALGDRNPPRVFIGRLIGPLIRRVALGNDEPMRRNTPTVPGLAVADQRELDVERRRLSQMIDRFVAAGPQGCTTHPHSFFGPLTPEQWSILMYKHLDHHLRQFGA